MKENKIEGVELCFDMHLGNLDGIEHEEINL